MFDKRVGLTELTYGLTRAQYRSAAEAQTKAEQISVRPDDMANVLEDAMSLLARREALAARWLLQDQDVAPVLGPIGATVWKNLQENVSLGQLAMNYEYRIEAGSARKPNNAGKVESLQIAIQTMGPTLQGLIGQGVVGPWNALISDWAEALQIDASRYMIPEPPPPPPPPGPADPASPAPGGGGAPSPEDVPPPEQVPQELQ
jgi:hypothetical protein